MALKTVAQLKDSVSAMLANVDLSNVSNLNGALERAARVLCQNADVPEASQVQNITLYGGVYNYPCDTRVFGTAITDIRPQGISRTVNDFVYKRPGEQFDRVKGWLPNGTMTTFEYSNGVPIIRIEASSVKPEIVIDPMSETTGWTAAGSASALAQDTTVYYETPASLRVTLTGSSAGTLTKTLQSPIDLSTYENVGVAFLAIRMPDGATASNLTSISLKLGSDSSNYDTSSDTDGFLGTWVSGEWLLVALNFAGASPTGTPDWGNIQYVQITLNHTATFTNFWVGGLFIALPNPFQILFQSAAIFKATGVAATTEITADTDTIILNDPAYTIYEYESALSILQQTGGANSDSMVASINSILHGQGTKIGLYTSFSGDNPSQELRTVGSWYDSGGFGGRRY